MIYKVQICPYCEHQAVWDQRDRISFGWYCSNHRDKTRHPMTFHGYLTTAHDRRNEFPVKTIEVVPIGVQE